MNYYKYGKKIRKKERILYENIRFYDTEIHSLSGRVDQDLWPVAEPEISCERQTSGFHRENFLWNNYSNESPKHDFDSVKPSDKMLDANPLDVRDWPLIDAKEHGIVYDESYSLSNDFLSAMRNNSFTDISLKCGDYIQQVHKFVLSARSPVFEAMFSTPMEESEKCVVTISDIDASVLDDLLTFLYGAHVKNLTLTKANDLLYVAEKYQVKGLKDICTSYLRSCLSIQTALQILQFADLYDEELKQDALRFICKNFSALKTTEEWKTLQCQKPNLSIEVYSMVVDEFEEKIVWRNT